MFNYKLEGIMEENFLPIGSVVKLKGGQNEEKIYNYFNIICCLYYIYCRIFQFIHLSSYRTSCICSCAWN